MTLGDLRAKAVLTLCAIYGLRRCEIAGLRLDDFDWYSETLTVRRGKRGRILQFPLQYEVGEAVLQYIKLVRPRCSCRQLFVTRYYPHRPVLATTLRPIVNRRMIELRNQIRADGTARSPARLRDSPTEERIVLERNRGLSWPPQPGISQHLCKA